MENLIFDIGFHKGEDTLFYLLKGYRVIAVDADPDLINEWQNIFKKYIENGKLLLLNYVISDTNDVDTDFYIGPNTIWSSTKVSISSISSSINFKSFKALIIVFLVLIMEFLCLSSILVFNNFRFFFEYFSSFRSFSL